MVKQSHDCLCENEKIKRMGELGTILKRKLTEFRRVGTVLREEVRRVGIARRTKIMIK